MREILRQLNHDWFCFAAPDSSTRQYLDYDWLEHKAQVKDPGEGKARVEKYRGRFNLDLAVIIWDVNSHLFCYVFLFSDAFMETWENPLWKEVKL